MIRPVRRTVLAIILTCTLLLALYLPAASSRADVRQSSLVSDEPVHDFGIIEQDSRATHVFVLSNRGAEPIRVLDVTASCGCTSTLLSSKLVSPGASVRLEVTLKPGPRRGAVRKSVWVHVSDTTAPMTLSLEGTIRPLFRVEPETIDFGEVSVGGVARRRVVLRALREGLDLVPGASTAPGLAVDVSTPVRIRDGVWTLELTARPTSPRDRIRGVATVPTGIPRVRNLVLRTDGSVLP